ncbi:formylglycine-generating enzyme family protein [Terriglobus sp. 2YAB30_2]|uniref:formylglycine-generating enzyme family protein n=1 Tax=unclassified Terriglobus TaxID=2628988 RepID=UPI003F96FFAC
MAIGAFCFAAGVPAQDHFHLTNEGITAPACTDETKEACTAADYRVWLADLKAWRADRHIRMGYDSSLYELPALKWTQSSFIQPQMMIEDRYFFDIQSGKYTVDRYLDDLVKRYGGVDAVLIWQSYPNIGIDDRNQYDMLRDMPGGITGVKKMVDEFHQRSVKVFFPVMVWDQGTRDEGKPNWTATAELLKAVGADGVNGDTLEGMPRAFHDATMKIGHPLALEPENMLTADDMLTWNTMSWGYWRYPYAPEVSRYKWLEPRTMVNVSVRWSRKKTDNLQAAFFNGVGFESWENVWGIWNGLTPRDAETVRRLATMERALAPFLVSQGWQPYYPTETRGLFASFWPLNDDALWTLVNRSGYAMRENVLNVTNAPAGAKFYDVYHGTELTPRMHGKDALLSLEIEPHGYGAVLQVTRALTAKEQTLLATMREMTQRPLESFSPEWTFLPQKLIDTAPALAPMAFPEGMKKIPAGLYRFRVSGVEIEGNDDVGVDFQYPWEESPRRHHDHFMQMKSFWMDTYPVTNAQFKTFLDATSYQPSDTTNFLRDWKQKKYPDGWADRPVTWVSLEDARAYATWAGKRLPHEWEWQYAAQGLDGRRYPWGETWHDAAVPTPVKGRTLTEPDRVGAHPQGASPFGVEDMTGNVWQWTDEYQDEHTRAAVLRGGSYFQPQGSEWYFPQAYQNELHGKFLLMAPSEDRSGSVGFRCVMDIE